MNRSIWRIPGRLLFATRLVSAGTGGACLAFGNFRTRESRAAGPLVLMYERRHLIDRGRFRHVQFPCEGEVCRRGTKNDCLVFQKYGIPVIDDRDLMSVHRMFLALQSQCPTKLRLWADRRTARASRAILSIHSAPCLVAAKSKSALCGVGQIVSSVDNDRGGSPSRLRKLSASLTKRAKPVAMACRMRGSLASVGTPFRSYSIATAQPGPSADGFVSTPGAGKPRSRIPLCTSICASSA